MLCERSRQYRNDQRELRDKIYHELSHGCDGVKCRDCEDFDPIQFFGLDPQFPAPIGGDMDEPRAEYSVGRRKLCTDNRDPVEK